MAESSDLQTRGDTGGPSATSGQRASRTYEFCSLEALEETWQSECKSAAGASAGFRLTFVNVPVDIIHHLATDDNRISYFSKPQHIIILKMPTRYHETGTTVTACMFGDAVRRVRMESALTDCKSATAPETGRVASQGKSPDCSWGLTEWQGHDLRGWPQIVVESGYSEDVPDLRKDVDYWLDQGGSSVRLVLMVRCTKDEFALSAWLHGDGPGVYFCAGQISAMRPENAQEYELTEDSHNLTIPFKQIFLREPRIELGEGDIVLTTNDFLRYKERIEDIERAFHLPHGGPTQSLESIVMRGGSPGSQVRRGDMQ